MLDLLIFIYYNKIQDYVGGEDSKDGEVNREVKVEERRDNNDDQRDIKSCDIKDYNNKEIIDFITISLISSPPPLLLILSR